MKEHFEQSVSVWMETATIPEKRGLTTDLHVDVCVVGAGIAGMTTAYLLTREGKSVAVLDSRRIAAGQTQRTTAHLTNAHDDFYSEVEKIHGLEGIRIAANSHTSAIDTIETIVEQEMIDCDFQRLPGYFFCPPGQSTDILQLEFDAATRAGIEGLEIVGRAPITTYDTGTCLRYPRQAQFHPLKYLAHLAQLVGSRGGKIYADTPVKQVHGGRNASVETVHGRVVQAQAIVVATNSPINDQFALHTKMAPYLTYVIGARVPAGSITNALFWDTQEDYHYVRLQNLDSDHDILIVGGEDHKAGQERDQNARHGRLESWARERFPMIQNIEYRWSGMVMETTDGGAFIGRNPGSEANVYVATGDSGMGMTHGTIAGLLLTDLILGRENPWADYYDPSRKPVAGPAWRRFLSENVNVGLEYAQDWLGNGDRPAVSQLQCDQGTVIRHGFSKVAVYRDQTGGLHECSAVCPHLGCIVHWNDFEKVWDCPCHGSRFDALGAVINGPAISDLAHVDREQAVETGTTK
ncbi:MAG: FAD-dependent oxidoreductase [Planctomycetaceae bacterium]